MTLLALIRHGATDWSAAGLMQGRADRPLSEAGRAEVACWRLPPELDGFDWATSPLARARETASILLGREVPSETCLIEADWGAWEGKSLADLRAADAEAMRVNETRGLDFRPPGGESPRDVQARLRPWLAVLARAGRPTAAVTHKGVIRAMLGLATGWDFLGKPPARLRWDAVHLFLLAPDGAPQVERLNIPLAVNSDARAF
jgi:broad specificity phosphatase PhoE